jgi:hypothetical protein
MDFEDAVVVESFSSHELAETAVSLLRSEGVDAVVSADDAGGELPNLDMAGGVRVLVPSASLEFARELLHTRSES